MQKKWAKINHAGHCLRQLPVYKETISGLFTKLISGDYCRQYKFLKFLARVFSQQEFLTKVRAMNILSISLFPTMRSCINHKLRNCVFIQSYVAALLSQISCDFTILRSSCHQFHCFHNRLCGFARYGTNEKIFYCFRNHC